MYKRIAQLGVALGLLLGLGSPNVALAKEYAAAPAAISVVASSSDIVYAQRVMTKLGIPTGPVDGREGEATRQGLCTFRSIAGLPVSRASLSAADMAKLRAYDRSYSSISKIPASSKTARLVVEKTCQTMVYSTNKRLVRIFRVTTGNPKLDDKAMATPSGTFRLAGLAASARGWTCSEYPNNCKAQTTGKDAHIRAKGNMYDKRRLNMRYNIYIHGTPPGGIHFYPGSHGCIRASTADMDKYINDVPSGTVVVIR